MDTDDAIRLHEASARGLRSIGLAEVLADASLQTRLDRKYVVEPSVWQTVLDELRGSLRALDIDGRRSFRYESVYFDTGDLASYHRTARGRPDRFKVRTRTYHDTGTCVLEVKRTNGRDETVKVRVDHPSGDRDRLGPHGTAFVASLLAPGHDVADLRPVLVTTYRRTTLVEAITGSRVTCDAALRWEATDGRAVGLPDRFVLEVKARRGSTPVDRLLWAHGHRPATFSKFGTGLAALHPHLPANKWNRTLRQHLGWRPARAG
jgi:hypothetical protein